MRITVNQLKRIIREEVGRTLGRGRRLAEAEDIDGGWFISIPDVSVRAKCVGMTVDAFVQFVGGLAAKHNLKADEDGDMRGIEVDEGGYSKEYDSLMFYGSQADLTAFAEALDAEFGFVKFIDAM